MTLPLSPTAPSNTLSRLGRGRSAVVINIANEGLVDPVAQRLRELGFVPGETVKLITRGPIGGDPLLVQVGYTRFALRLREAARVLIQEPAT